MAPDRIATGAPVVANLTDLNHASKVPAHVYLLQTNY
jgi:hypothetical protein